MVHMVRDPYSWLIALARRPYHMKGPNAASLEAFTQRPWMTERREGMPSVVASPLSLWSLKMAAVQDSVQQAAEAGLPSAVVRFEDFVQDPAGQATRVIAALGLPQTELAPQQDNTKPGAPSLVVLRTYYREEQWASWLTETAVARINDQMDWALAGQFGYQKRAPQDYPAEVSEEVAARMAVEMSGLRTPSHSEAVVEAASHGEAGPAPAT